MDMDLHMYYLLSLTESNIGQFSSTMKVLWKVLIIIFACYSQSYSSIVSYNFLTISDIHFDQTRIITNYDHETGKQLLRNVFKKLSTIITKTKPTFIIYLGDLPAYNITKKTRISENRQVLERLQQLAKVNIPLFYVPGNNDALGGDYHSFANASGMIPTSTDPNPQWPGIDVKKNCQHSQLHACFISLQYAHKFGFYSAYPLGHNKHLELIVLNSVIFSPYYHADDHVKQTIAAQLQLQWLAEQLKAAALHKDFVLIAMHIPPGMDSYSRQAMWTNKITLENHQTINSNFLNLINQYHNIIKGVLASHTHFDQLNIIENAKGKKLLLVSYTPGVSPQHGNNPGFKSYTYNSNNFDIINATTYYTTPTASSWGNTSYTFANNFHCQVGISLLACVNRLNTKDLQTDIKKIYSLHAANFEPPQGWAGIFGATVIKYRESNTTLF